MKVTEATYSRPVAETTVNPEVLKLVQPFAEKGVDTAFAVETTKAESAADKAKMQVAVISLGYTAREVDKLAEDDLKALDNSADVTLTFVIRPKRKPRGAGQVTETDAE